MIAQREAGLGEQAGQRDDRCTQRAQLRVVLVPAGDPGRRLHRVETAGADLVGTAEYRHGVHRRRRRDRAVHERLEERHVGPVRMTDEVDDGVGVAGVFGFRFEEVTGAS